MPRKMKIHYFAGVIILLFSLDGSAGAGACYRDEDCRKPHMVCRRNVTSNPAAEGSGEEVGMCVCLAGWITWKWSCYPPSGLGEVCVTSQQCQVKIENSMCNPINHRCSCSRDHVPKRVARNYTLKHSNSSEEPTHVTGTGLICIPIQAKLETATKIVPIYTEDKEMARPKHRPDFVHGAMQNAVHQTVRRDSKASFDAFLLILFLILGLVVAIVATIFYIKAIQEKKLSQAAVRSLLNLITENENSMKNSTTTDSLKTHATEIISSSNDFAGNSRSDNGLRGAYRNNPCYEAHQSISGESNNENAKGANNMVDAAILEVSNVDFTSTLPSKIKLEPLQSALNVRLPDPHLSHPTLPPIKRTIGAGGQTQSGGKGTPRQQSLLLPQSQETLVPDLGRSTGVTEDNLRRFITPTTCGGFEDDFVPRIPMEPLNPRNLLYYKDFDSKSESSPSAASFPDDATVLSSEPNQASRFN